MRKRSKYKPKPKHTPMLVRRGSNDKLDTMEHMLIATLEMGMATTEVFDNLSDMQGVLLLGSSVDREGKGKEAWEISQAVGKVLIALREEYHKTGEFRIDAEQFAVLKRFVWVNREFWLRRPVELYEAAATELSRRIVTINEKRAGIP